MAAQTEASRGASARREDVLKDIEPYCGDPFLERSQEDVPSLHLLCVRCVVCRAVPYERCSIPASVRLELDMFRRLQQWPAPKLMMCSTCEKFYTTQKKFDKHKCRRSSH